MWHGLPPRPPSSADWSPEANESGGATSCQGLSIGAALVASGCLVAIVRVLRTRRGLLLSPDSSRPAAAGRHRSLCLIAIAMRPELLGHADVVPTHRTQ